MRTRFWLPIACVAAAAWAGAAGCSDDGDGSSSTGPTTTTTTTSSGGGEGGGGAGGAGGGASACDDPAQALAVGEPLTLDGTTEGAADSFSSTCGDTTAASDAPDAHFALTIAAAGTLRLDVSAAAGSALMPALDVRTVCEQAELCAAPAGGAASLAAHVEAGPLHVIVDGAQGTRGAFQLTAELSAPACGDGVVNPGEQCDPGAGVAGDACVDPGQPGECQFVTPQPEQETCPGEGVAVPLGTTVLAADQGHFTYGYADDHEGSCAEQPGGVDRVYQLIPQADGMMTVSVGFEPDGITPSCDIAVESPGCWPKVVYARTSCPDAASEVACGLDPLMPMAPQTLQIPVTSGASIFLFIDGYDAEAYSAGTFNLHVSLQ